MKLLAERGGKSVVTGEGGAGVVCPPPALDSRHEKLSVDELNVTRRRTCEVFERIRVSSVVQSGGDKGDMMAGGSGVGDGGGDPQVVINQSTSLCHSALCFCFVFFTRH